MSNEDRPKLDLTLRLGFDDKQKIEDNTTTLESNNQDYFSRQLGQANANVNLDNLNSSTYGTSAIGHIVAPVTDLSASIPYGFRHDNIAISTRRSNNARVCKECGVDHTPLWRKGPDGPQVSFFLQNAT
ncbi:GATA-type domain-containing protein [Forsythia ovata]|uniref:GATA-type domain-containing protein n=1 Tax=Forsythia ovata TaxID=205694 RepID=A0ABD1RHM0_9LAMI